MNGLHERCAMRSCNSCPTLIVSMPALLTVAYALAMAKSRRLCGKMEGWRCSASGRISFGTCEEKIVLQDGRLTMLCQRPHSLWHWRRGESYVVKWKVHAMPAAVSALALAKIGRWLCSKWRVDDALPAVYASGRLRFGTGEDRKMAMEIVGLLLSCVSTVSEFVGGRDGLMPSMCLTGRDCKSKGLEGDRIARCLKSPMLQVEIIWEIAGADDGMLKKVPRCHGSLERFLFLLVRYAANPFDLRCRQQPGFEYMTQSYQRLN
jgi:hypothetical protein